MDNIITIVLYVGLATVMAYIIPYCFRTRNSFNRKFAYFVAFLLPTLLAACRGNTGTDSNMYQNTYYDIENVQRWQDFELGYQMLVKLLNYFNLPYQFLFGIMGFLTCFFIILFIKNEKNNINVSVAVFIYFIDLYLGSFNIMRQGLAITMVLYAFSLFLDKKYIRFLIVILSACLFHSSAMLGFVIVAGKIIFDNRYSKFMYIVISGIVLYFVFHRELLGKIAYIISHSSYYASYITRDAESEGSILKYFLKIFPVLFISILFILQKNVSDRIKVYFGLMLGGYLISVLGVITATQVHRIGYYFSYLVIIVLSSCCNSSIIIGNKKITTQTTSVVVVLYFILVFFYNYVYRGFCDLIPYQGLFPL